MASFADLFNAITQGLANPQLPPFKVTYRCYPVAFINKEKLEEGDKILLPASALDHLARLKVVYPMMFSLFNPRTDIKTHCGVMEFSAQEGVAYLPYWMMELLALEDGGLIIVENVTLPKGTFVKFRPHTIKFTELSNPRVVLEKALRNFTCLTKGDTIKITVDDIPYYLDVTETKPAAAVSIIETDMQVEFDAPKDMKVEEKKVAPTPVKTNFEPIVPMETKTDSPSPIPPKAEASSYFANLSTPGYSLKSAKRTASASPPATTLASSANAIPKPTPSPPITSIASQSKPAGISSISNASMATPKPASTTPSPSVSPALPLPNDQSSQQVGRTVVEKGGFRYIYETDKATNRQKLIKREPIPNTNTFTAFGGSGHILGTKK